MIYDTAFYEVNQENALSAARTVVNILFDYYHPQSVVDVGCGTGGWLSVFKSLGCKVHGYDSMKYADMLLIDPEEFTVIDLSKQMPPPDKFDLAMSLEAAEHLPKSAAESLIASLTRFAPVVMFSAAWPGQGGVGHINERWFTYWERLFASRGYYPLDPIRPRIWYEAAIPWYYRSNILLYASEAFLDSHPAMKTLADAYAANPLTLAHKRLFRPGPLAYLVRRGITRLRKLL